MLKRLVNTVLITALFAAAPLYAQEAASAPPVDKISQLKAYQAREKTQKSEAGSLDSIAKWRSGPGSETAVIGTKLLQGFGICAGMLLIAVYLLKKFGNKLPQAGGRRIRVKERTAISTRTSLLLVEIDGRSLLMAVGGDNVTFYDSDLDVHLARESHETEVQEEGLGLICAHDLGQPA